MERLRDGSFLSTLFRDAPWVVGFRVRTTLTVPLDALLNSSARFAIIQLSLADPLLAITRIVPGKVCLIQPKPIPCYLLDLFRFSVRLPPVYASTFLGLSNTAPPRQRRLAAPMTFRHDENQDEFETDAMEIKLL
jgi:hypothetical protein